MRYWLFARALNLCAFLLCLLNNDYQINSPQLSVIVRERKQPQERKGVYGIVCCCVLAPGGGKQEKGQSVGACVVSVLCVPAPVTKDSSCEWVGTSLLHTRKRSVALKLVLKDAK